MFTSSELFVQIVNWCLIKYFLADLPLRKFCFDANSTLAGVLTP